MIEVDHFPTTMKKRLTIRKENENVFRLDTLNKMVAVL